MRVTYGVEHEAAIRIEAYLAFISMGLRFILIFGYFQGVHVNVEKLRPEGKFRGIRGYAITFREKNRHQMYARVLPKPPGARDCDRRASQSRKSRDWEIRLNFSDNGVIDGWRRMSWAEEVS
jgi:hypothetical protein